MNTMELVVRVEGQDSTPLPYDQWRKFAESPVHVLTAVRQLSPSLRNLFIHVLKRTGPLPFHEEAIESWQDANASGAEIIAALPVWYEAGLLAVFRKTWGERLYAVPIDVYQAVFADILNDSEEGSITGKMRKEQPDCCFTQLEASSGAVGDLFRLLVRTANEGLPLTAKGTLHKRIIQRLEAQFQMSNEALAACNISYGFAEDVSPRLAITLDLALRMGIVRKDIQSFTLQTEALKHWLHQPVAAWNTTMWRLAAQHYTSADVQMKHIVYGFSAARQSDEWIRAKDVLERLQQIGCLQEERLADNQSWTAWLHACHTLGWCELGKGDDGHLWYKWLVSEYVDSDESMEGTQGFFVQPDFEVIVPPDCPLAIRWELEYIAEHASSAGMHIYRLTRDSFQAAIDAGYTRQRQQAFLEHYAMSGIPENIIDAWDRWNEQYGRVWFSEAVLLRCEDTAAANRIQQELHRGKLEQKLTMIGPTAFIVAREHIEEVRTAMEKIGLSPLKQWKSEDEGGHSASFWTMDKELESTSPQSMTGTPRQAVAIPVANGIVYSPSSLQYYEMDAAYCRDEVWLSPYRGLPLMWMRELRTYHASTMKELVETAIRLQLALEIKLEVGEAVRVVPIRLNEGVEGDYTLDIYAAEASRTIQKTLIPSRWGGVRLIVPEWLDG